MIIGENGFIHHVFFWLKKPESQADFERLVDGLKKLSVVKTIQQIHIGKPASTRREVIDSTYSVSLLLVFNDKDGHDSYQVDPIHLKFVEECAPLWSKVVIYDTVGI